MNRLSRTRIDRDYRIGVRLARRRILRRDLLLLSGLRLHGLRLHGLRLGRLRLSHRRLRRRQKLLGLPIKLSETPGSIESPPPEFGEHTDQVLSSLGYDAKAIARLRRRGDVA